MKKKTISCETAITGKVDVAPLTGLCYPVLIFLKQVPGASETVPGP
ncbi:hypothetical protein [Enterocloster lavalensis]|nr:hypothetical protein [Enterocloster lavalensis]